MLFGLEEFVLYEQREGLPISYMTGKWTDAGSVQAIRAFFDGFLGRYRGFSGLCEQGEVTPIDPETFPSCDCGFLGQGALLESS